MGRRRRRISGSGHGSVRGGWPVIASPGHDPAERVPGRRDRRPGSAHGAEFRVGGSEEKEPQRQRLDAAQRPVCRTPGVEGGQFQIVPVPRSPRPNRYRTHRRPSQPETTMVGCVVGVGRVSKIITNKEKRKPNIAKRAVFSIRYSVLEFRYAKSRSPVRMLYACSTGQMNTRPSPISPVRAASRMA